MHWVGRNPRIYKEQPSRNRAFGREQDAVEVAFITTCTESHLLPESNSPRTDPLALPMKLFNNVLTIFQLSLNRSCAQIVAIADPVSVLPYDETIPLFHTLFERNQMRFSGPTLFWPAATEGWRILKDGEKTPVYVTTNVTAA